jgi:hypothetical protein
MKHAVATAIDLYAREIAGGRTASNLGPIVDEALETARRLAADGKSGLARAALRRAAEQLRRDEQERRTQFVERVTHTL